MPDASKRKVALGERLLQKRRVVKQRIAALEKQIGALKTSLDQNKSLYEQFVAALPAKEV
jgi:hypothetical protein